MADTRLDHNLHPNHPALCSPCAVTIYDQDCLLEDGATWVSWTGNLTAEKVLMVLQRAETEVRKHIETQMDDRSVDSGHQTAPGGNAAELNDARAARDK